MATGTVLPVITRVQHDSGNGFAQLVQDAKRAGDQVRQQFDKDFAEIGRMAQQALAIPRNAGGSLDLNAGQYREAAADARAYATALREVANASVTAAREAGDTSAETRRYIQAASAAAREAEGQARELTQTAQTYEKLQQALNQTASATDRVVQSSRSGTTAYGAVTNSVRASRVAYVQLGQQMQDVVIQAQMGTNAFQIFTQQVPQAAFALSGLGGTVGTVARVLSGPLGAGLIAATALLGPLITNLITGGNAADDTGSAMSKLKDKLDLSNNSYESLKAVVDEYNKVQDKSTALTYEAITAHEKEAEALLKKAEAKLAVLEADDPSRFAGDSTTAATLVGANASMISSLRSRIEELKKDLTEAQIGAGSERAKRATDERYNIEVSYNEKIAKLEEKRRANLIDQVKYEEQRVKLLNQQEAALKAFDKANRSSGSRGIYETAAFGSPLAGRNVSRGNFGQARPGHTHAGVDLAVPTGTPVYAAMDGIVKMAAAAQDAYGTLIKLGHGANTETRYAHLSRLAVEKGDYVRKGDLIGYSGNTGRSTGPHLHYEVRRGGRAVDPSTGSYPVDPSTVAEAREKAADRAARSAEREARETARLAEFAETAGARVAQMREAFDETPQAILRSHSAMAQLADLASDLDEQVRRGLDPKIAEALKAEIERLKPVIEESINKPFNDLIKNYRERAAIDELLIQNRQVEAEVLSRSLDLERQQGKLSSDQLATLRETIVQERLRATEIEKQNELRQREAQLVDDTRDNLRGTLQSLARGGGIGAVGNLFKRQFDLIRTNVVDNLFENLFGDFFRNEKDKALGFDKVREASERQVTSINSVSDALDQLRGSVTSAAERMKNPVPVGADNDNFDPNAEIVVVGNSGGKKLGGTAQPKLPATPRDFLSTLVTSVADVFLDKSTAAKIGEGIAGGLTRSQGAGYGMLGGGLVLGQGGSPLGSAIGGALGEKVLGKALGKGLESISKSLGSLGGPLGGILGGIAGGLIGGLMTSTPRASSTIGVGANGQLQVTGTTGNNSQFKRASEGSAGEALSSLQRIADALGATLDGSVGSVSIGVRKGNYRVDPTGSGITKTSKGAIDFGEDSAAAIRAATLDLIKDGVLAGLRQSTQNLLQGAKDLDTAIQKALDFESIFTRLKEFKDPLGAALDALDKEFTRLIRIATEANATEEEMAKLEELYGFERADVIKQAMESELSSLRDFVKSLEVGDSGLSLRDRLTNARTVFDPLAATLRSGGKVDYDKFTEAAQDYLSVARELFGSQTEYFAIFNDVLGLSKKALADQENIVSIGSGRPSPFDKPSIDTVPVVEAVDAQSQMLLTQLSALNASNADIAAAINALASLNGLQATGTTYF